MEWVLVEDKSISMKEAVARNLLRALRDHLAVADEDSSDGSYLIIPVEDGIAQLGTHDPTTVASVLTRVLGQTDIVKHLGEANLSDELVAAMRGAVRLRELQTAVAQLRYFLENGEASEQVYQEWCMTHSWAFGNAYVMRDDVRDVSPSDTIDLLFSTVIAGYRDIVELKRPDADVLRRDESHRNYYWSADVTRAIGQCHRYLDVLQEEAHQGLRDHPEVVAYHPRATIVIGRSDDWGQDQLRGLHGLNARLSGISVMTYDHLLNQGERLVQILSQRADEEPEFEELEQWDDESD
jgi:hypothetical protein